MILGFHYHIPAMIKNEKIIIPGYLGVFIDSLSIHFSKIICFMHTPKENEKKLLDYEIKSLNIELINIGSHDHMFKRGFFPNKYIKNIKPFKNAIDIMLIRGPSPLLPYITKFCKMENIPFSFLLVGDYLEGLNAAKDMNKLKKIILFIYYKNNKNMQDKFIKNEPIFVNSKLLFDEYEQKVSSCIQIKTTTLSKTDFFKRDDTCNNKDINLLYTGRIDPTKGLIDIFEAVSNLKNKGYKNLKINFVGWETKKGFLKELDKLSIQLNLTDEYIFHGKKTVGKELFDMYKKSDIYILASKGDFEGFPRTLWESMANSLPIIATKVGSIPYYLSSKNAILVQPNNVKELENAISNLISDTNNRKKIIREAYILAQTNTLEIQALNLTTKLKEYINDK